MARWCSRLARQPVTLEVDGSSPFRVAKKKIEHSLSLLFYVICQELGSNYPIQQSGGLLIAAGLDGGDTIVKRVRSGSLIKNTNHKIKL